MTQFEEDLELAKNISTILKSLYDGKFDSELTKFFSNSNLLTFKTPKGTIHFSSTEEIYIASAIWSGIDTTTIQIQMNSDVIILESKNSISVLKNIEESEYFQNSLIYDSNINTWILIISYIINNLRSTGLTSVTFENDIIEVVKYLKNNLGLEYDTI